MANISDAGIGLLIEESDDAYHRFVDEVSGFTGAEAAADRSAVPTPEVRPQERQSSSRSLPKAAPGWHTRRSSQVATRPKARALAKPRPQPRATPGHEFKVRLSLVGSPRTRILTLTAASEAEARSQALAKVGEGWEILAVER